MFDNIIKGIKEKLGGAMNNSGIDTELIWQKIKEGSGKAGRETTKIGLELYQVMKAKDTPFYDKAIIGAALAYQFLPNDMISTKNYGALGAIDNAVTLGVAYSRMKKRVTPEIEASVKAQLDQWFGPEAAAKTPEPVAEIAPQPVVTPEVNQEEP